MAIMIPEKISLDTQSQAEVKAYKHFQKVFDDSWTIFHSFSMHGENLEGKLIDAEADFVFFHKDFGILVLEVKGGILEFDGRGRCFQYAKEIYDPEKQARHNKYNLKRILNRKLHDDPQIKYAHAVYFPDTFQDIIKFPPRYSDIAFTGNDTPYILKNVIELLSRIKFNRRREMSEGLAKAVLKALSPNLSVGNTIIDQIGQNRNTFNILTEIQSQLLKFISKYRHAMIEGSAGSGKTVLAVKKARQLALEGNKVLLLCYNTLLGKKLQESVDDLKDYIDAGNYHDFCVRCLSDSKYKDELDYKKPGFWERIIPDLMQKYIAEYPLDYDAVIIDEAQDFKEDYWFSFIEQIQTDKYFYMFYDPDQNIFDTKMSFPEMTTPFTLNRVCRNTNAIFEYMKLYSDNCSELFDNIPEGEDVAEFDLPDDNLRNKQLGKILKNLIHEHDVKGDNIVILGGHSFNNTVLSGNSKFGDIVVVDSNDEIKPSNEIYVKYYTYMRFKGCEADVVILLDVDKNDPRWDDNGMYTAVSRAKNLLYVLRK
ncbi:MAG: AAA family ATPase [bacterium]|nr:AAA family ATPase [bacterium]